MAAHPAPSTTATDLEPLAPGGRVLARQALRDLIAQGAIASDAGDPLEHLQPASLDLTLGPVAYRLRCSFLPGTARVRDRLADFQMGELDLQKGAVLEQDRPYLIPLNERLALPRGLRGRTNPRSSTGRVDVFTRVITDAGQHFDEIRDGYEGELFLEVVPKSFTVRVRQGLRLNQLRLRTGDARVTDAELALRSTDDPIVYRGLSMRDGETAHVANGLLLSVDLTGEGRSFVGYRARKHTGLLDLARTRAYEPADFWERIPVDRAHRLILEPKEFYLLVSRERVRIPPTMAAEMAAYDPASGELRTHYAGFFDPGFGDVGGRLPGTPAVLEVRAHDVPFALEHGQRLCTLSYESMAEVPDELYGSALGSNYQSQWLALSRPFKDDPAARARGGRLEHASEPLLLELTGPDSDEVGPLVVLPRE